MKKLISAMIALCSLVVCLCLLPQEVKADTEGCYTYTVSKDQATITGFDGTVGPDIVIPDTLGGYPVVSIAANVFKDYYGITSVLIPNTVTNIGASAFANCWSLTSMKIPDSVTTIGDYAFENCINLSKVTLSKSLTYIGRYAFIGTKLESIVIPKSLESCGAYVHDSRDYSLDGVGYGVCGGPFALIDTLKQVTFEDGMTIVPANLLRGCTGIEQIVIPNTVEVIKSAAFGDCLRLNSVNIGSGVTIIEGSAFHQCVSLQSINLPNSLTTIGGSAFQNCIVLPSIAISDSVTSIGSYAFAGCTGLTSIVIPDSVTTIDDYAFENCANLSTVTLSKSLTYIGRYAFIGTKLESIVIPKSLESCGTYVHDSRDYSLDGVGYGVYGGPFGVLDTLKQVTFEKGTTIIPANLFRGCTGIEQVVIPDTVEVIKHDAFADCLQLNSVTIGSGVAIIEGSSFNQCVSLQSINFPASLTTIGGSAFKGCKSLPSVVMADNVTTIDNYAFENCANLSKVTLSKSLTYIGRYAFTGTSLQSIEIPKSLESCGAYGNETKSYSLNGVDYRVYGGPFGVLDTLKQVTFEEGTTIIPPYLLQGCTGIEQIVIPDTVEVIKYNAFADCLQLNSVTIGSGVAIIEGSAFNQCVSLQSINLPDSLNTIGYAAFDKCISLPSVEIPESVTSIYNYAFSNCTALTEIIFNGTIPTIEGYAFNAVTANAYYPEDNATWTEDVMVSYGGNLTWLPYCRIPGRVDRWNVSLSDDLIVNFYMRINEKIADTARVRIYVGDTSVTYRVANMEKTEDDRYIARVSISAAQMSDYILVTVLNCTHIGETQTYTVRQYADIILADESYSEYHALIKEMLNYGAAAQNYFDYETHNLANSGITDAGSVEVPDSVDTAFTVSGEAEGVTFYGASLVFRDKIAVRYYFDFVGSIKDCQFTANGNACSPHLKDGMYYVEVDNIMPQDLDQPITLTVTDAQGHILEINYSPLNYIVRMDNKGSATMKALVKALYNYHLAAKALRTTV